MVATLADEGRPPAHLGMTYWSARLLADQLGISFATVARSWRKWEPAARRLRGLDPLIGGRLHLRETTTDEAEVQRVARASTS